MAQELIIPIRFLDGHIVPYNLELWAQIKGMNEGKNVMLTVKPFFNSRSLKQNAYYWGFMVAKMRTFYTEFYGEEISKDDIHSYNIKSILGEDFMIKEVLSVPIISRTSKTPSQMNTKEFANFIKETQKLWAEHGLYIPDQDIYFGDLNENKNGN